MKKLLLLVGSLSLFASVALASDSTLDVYAVNAKTDKNQSSKGGLGVYFDSEAVKVKLEGTSDFIKGGAVLKFNPYNSKWYIKVGANALNIKQYAPDGKTARVNQFSGALAAGYMVRDDIYVELGGSLTKLKGKKLGVDYEILDETTKQAYVEAVKRTELPFGLGTLDASANIGIIDYEYSDNETSYGGALNYYPTDKWLIKYAHQHEDRNIENKYKVQYEGYFVEYNDNISSDTWNVKLGISISVGDWGDFSTYKMANPKPKHLSSLDRFENMTFSDNMNLRSSGGVQETQAKKDKDAASATPAIVNPTITLADQTVNDNGGGLATNLPAPTVGGVNAGATYAIVGNPAPGEISVNSSTGVITYDGDVGGPTIYSVTLRVTNTDTGTASVTFNLNVNDNG